MTGPRILVKHEASAATRGAPAARRIRARNPPWPISAARFRRASGSYPTPCRCLLAGPTGALHVRHVAATVSAAFMDRTARIPGAKRTVAIELELIGLFFDRNTLWGDRPRRGVAHALQFNHRKILLAGPCSPYHQ